MEARNATVAPRRRGFIESHKNVHLYTVLDSEKPALQKIKTEPKDPFGLASPAKERPSPLSAVGAPAGKAGQERLTRG